jgi:predicted ArsR family transcriptional regulator
MRCPHCGTPQEVPQRDLVPQGSSAQPEGIERNVLDYIIAHNGTISLSQAAQDLTVSPDVLQSVIERLKAAGFLNQT